MQTPNLAGGSHNRRAAPVIRFAEKALAVSSAERSAREEDDAQNDVKDVIHLAEHQ